MINKLAKITLKVAHIGLICLTSTAMTSIAYADQAIKEDHELSLDEQIKLQSNSALRQIRLDLFENIVQNHKQNIAAMIYLQQPLSYATTEDQEQIKVNYSVKHTAE